MIEIGVFHNGASDLPTISTPDEVEVNDGTLAEVHESSQRVLLEQIRQGILADLYDISKRVSGETLLKKGVALAGRPADVAEEIIKIKEGCGYEDYIVNAWFETERDRRPDAVLRRRSLAVVKTGLRRPSPKSSGSRKSRTDQWQPV